MPMQNQSTVNAVNARRNRGRRECAACRKSKSGLEFSSSSPVCIACCRRLHLIGLGAASAWVKKQGKGK